MLKLVINIYINSPDELVTLRLKFPQTLIEKISHWRGDKVIAERA